MTLATTTAGIQFWTILLLLAWVSPLVVTCWTILPTGTTTTYRRSSSVAKRSSSYHPVQTIGTTTTRRQSTPFEMDYYDDGSDNPFAENVDSSLAVPSDTKLIVGLNKYSHDATICAADAETGNVLFALSKERLTRKKHDSGNVATLVETCLECLDLDLDSITKVVMNNHHHRVLPVEANLSHLEWEAGLGINGGAESGYNDEENLLGHAERLELSHHLAHAYSTATQSPFDKGLVIVMDGMGETYRTMLNAEQTKDPSYVSDFSFGIDSFTTLPSDLSKRSQESCFDWREAESVYVFEKKKTAPGGKLSLKPVFKRFTQEHSPPTLYNHGFENMDSAGALYSRASSHIFGDWNACGKVMGLAPWIGHSWSSSTEDDDDDEDERITPRKEEKPIMWGTLYSEEEGKQFQVDRSQIMGMPLIARMDSDMFDDDGNLVRERRYDFDDNDIDITTTTSDDNDEIEDDSEIGSEDTKKVLPTKVALDAITLAHRIQIDLENIVIDFVKHFQQETGEKNLCIAGGVGLNSVLNGKLCRELGFEKTFISPYPGDDGIAVGCCAYGLFGNEILDGTGNQESSAGEDSSPPPLWTTPLSPYLGPDRSESEIKAAIDAAAPWLEFEAVRDDDRRVDLIAQEIQSGSIVAWYQGRSELGPRALGHRSILADPRKKSMVRFINQYVKKRESFRPFAPSVLAEEASDWFDMGEQDGDNQNKSPYMSLTAMVHEDKRRLIPAVTHVDGSSRLQTVTAEAEPLYHKLISKFYELTGVPLVLNTSFNIDAPITESPTDAIQTFLCSMGSIEILVMGDYIIKRKQPNLRVLLGEAAKNSDEFIIEPGFPRRAGRAYFESKFEFEEGETDQETMVTTTRVRMPERPMHLEKNDGWVDLMDELEGELLAVCDGTVSLNDIMAQYNAVDEDEEISSDAIEDSQVLLQNIVHRLVRLYEQTLISW